MTNQCPPWMDPLAWAVLDYSRGIYVKGVGTRWLAAGCPVLARVPRHPETLTLPPGHFETVQVLADAAREAGVDARLVDLAVAECVERVKTDSAVPWALLERWSRRWGPIDDDPELMDETHRAFTSRLDGCPADLHEALADGWVRLHGGGIGVYDEDSPSGWRTLTWLGSDRRRVWTDAQPITPCSWTQEASGRFLWLEGWERIRAWKAGAPRPWGDEARDGRRRWLSLEEAIEAGHAVLERNSKGWTCLTSIRGTREMTTNVADGDWEPISGRIPWAVLDRATVQHKEPAVWAAAVEAWSLRPEWPVEQAGEGAA